MKNQCDIHTFKALDVFPKIMVMTSSIVCKESKYDCVLCTSPDNPCIEHQKLNVHSINGSYANMLVTLRESDKHGEFLLEDRHEFKNLGPIKKEIIPMPYEPKIGEKTKSFQTTGRFSRPRRDLVSGWRLLIEKNQSQAAKFLLDVLENEAYYNTIVVTFANTMREIYKLARQICKCQRILNLQNLQSFSINSISFLDFEFYVGFLQKFGDDVKIFCDTLNFPIFYDLKKLPRIEYFQKVPCSNFHKF